MVSKTATTVTVLQSQHSLGNKSHNGKKTFKQKRNGNATSQVKPEKTSPAHLRPRSVPLLLPRAHLHRSCRSTQDFAFQGPSLAHCMGWEIQTRCKHTRDAGGRQHRKFLTWSKCQAMARGGESSAMPHPLPQLHRRRQYKEMVIPSLQQVSLFFPPLSGRLVLGCITRSTASRSGEGILPLCSTLMRAHLESCVQLWSPQHRRDMDLLEMGQRRPQKWSKG